MTGGTEGRQREDKLGGVVGTGRGWARAALAVAVVVHLVVLYSPRVAGPDGMVEVPHLDKLVHAAVFGAVLLAGLAAGVPRAPLTLLLLAHAAVSEMVQAAALPARSGSPADALVDVAGIGLGWAAAGWHARASERSG